MSHIPSSQQTEFEERVTLLLNSTLSQSGSTKENFSESSDHILDKNFLCQCQQQLIDLVGPFGPLLIQETLKSSAGISPQELVDKLATKIPDVQVAAEFQQRMSLWSQNKNLSSS